VRDTDPAPLTRSQLRVVLSSARRELSWTLRLGSCEIAHWRRAAHAIPDPVIRQDALDALERKRTHAHGAALFCILPRRPSPNLVRLLVAYELIWDLLDNLSERAAAAGFVDGRALHSAIAEAIDPGLPISDYYACAPHTDDGGYLHALVATCRDRCAQLPSYGAVRDFALADAQRAQVLALNHHPDPRQRAALLRAWAEHQFPGSDMPWWELSGAASAPLPIHVLLALAAEPGCDTDQIGSVHAAYFPWVAAATTMLDSYVDRQDDAANGAHSYVSHYPQAECLVSNLRLLLSRSIEEVSVIDQAPKHLTIVAAMAAMYLSKAEPTSDILRLVGGGGSLTRMFLPLLRGWRLAFGQGGV
jgi:tetraprenyl-beta-curcumene synthase